MYAQIYNPKELRRLVDRRKTLPSLSLPYCNIKISKFDSTERKFDTKKLDQVSVHVSCISQLRVLCFCHKMPIVHSAPFRNYFRHNRELMNIQTKDNSVLNEAEHDK